jgi:lactate dehydrogenase-like 2-hydroxyacid dehydrogenase
MADPLIVVPDDFPSVFEGSAAQQRAAALGAMQVYSVRGADEQDELVRRLGRARIAINIRAHARFTDAVLAACPKLQMISIWGTGTDNVDLGAAGRRGLTVCNTPGVNALAVAEHAIALMLAAGRKIPRIDGEMRGGAWPREMLAQCLGKTLGVFGTGTIGTRDCPRSRPGDGRPGLSAAPTPSASRPSAPPRRPRKTFSGPRTSSACTCAWCRRPAASSAARSSPS